MSDEPTAASQGRSTARGPDLRATVEIAVRLGALVLLVGWCFLILAPFAGIVIWALIIAIATEDLCGRLAKAMGGRQGLAAALLVTLALTTLIVPSVLLTETLVAGAQRFAGSVADGTFSVPPPPDDVGSWPIVGQRIHAAWLLASQNLGAALERLEPQLQAVSRWLLRAAGSAGVALLQLAGSIILAGFLLAHREGRHSMSERIARRLAGERGPEFAELANATVRSVVQGILGVAVIQAILAGLGFIVAGVPAAGLWALLVLVAAVVQLPVGLVMVPPIVWIVSDSSGLASAVFVAWCIAISLLDNVLKPLLFGRGVQVPMLVIFLGAIGGMLTMGIVGLFLGAVILALGYELFDAWLRETDSNPQEAAAAP